MNMNKLQYFLKLGRLVAILFFVVAENYFQLLDLIYEKLGIVTPIIPSDCTELIMEGKKLTDKNYLERNRTDNRKEDGISFT